MILEYRASPEMHRALVGMRHDGDMRVRSLPLAPSERVPSVVVLRRLAVAATSFLWRG